MATILKNARIYDGTGEIPFIGDVMIEGDRILQAAPQIDAPCECTIDLEGKSLAPGFIDGHSHNDWFAIKKEPLKYFEPFLRQGISSFVCGNCGVSEIGFDAGCKYVDLIGG